MAKKSEEIKVEYAGETITITAGGVFAVKFCEDDEPRKYETMEKARAAIDRSQKIKLTKKKLALAVVDDEGKEYTITGVHSGTGNLLTTPKANRYGTEFFAAVPRVREINAEEQSLRTRIEALIDERRKYGLVHRRFEYREEPSPEKIATNVAELEKNHAMAVAGKAN